MTTVPVTNGPTKAYLGDAVYAEIEHDMLKLTAEDGIEAANTIYLERTAWDMLRHYMERYGAKVLTLLAALLCLAAPVAAQVDEEPYTFVVYRDGDYFQFLWMIATADGLSVGPIDDTHAIALGRPEAPWQTGYFRNRVRASGFVASGRPGINAVLHVPGCTLTIQGGIIVETKPTDPFAQACP